MSDITMYDFIHIIQLRAHATFQPSKMRNCCVSTIILHEAQKIKFFVWIWKIFPLIGKVFAQIGQNFTIFSKNQKLLDVISIYKSLPCGQGVFQYWNNFATTSFSLINSYVQAEVLWRWSPTFDWFWPDMIGLPSPMFWVFFRLGCLAEFFKRFHWQISAWRQQQIVNEMTFSW